MKSTWHSNFQVGVLVFVGLGLATFAFFFPSMNDIVGPSPSNKGKNVAPLKTEVLDEVKKQITNPLDWAAPTSNHHLFVSDEYVYFPDRNVVEKRQDSTLVGPFPYAWLKKYDLPILDLTVATQDPDGDGFTNIMEYNPQDPKSGTNPIDPQSHPPYVTKLRVKDFKAQKVEFKFTTAQQLDGQDVYSIIVENEEGRRSFMKKKGEKIEGFEILGFTAKKEVQKNTATQTEDTVDVSELEVTNPEMEIKTAFVVGQAKNIPDINVGFVLALVDQVQQPFKVSRGKIFDVRGEKYRLLDATSAGAKIKNVATNQELTIPPLSIDDFRLLPQKAPTK